MKAMLKTMMSAYSRTLHKHKYATQIVTGGTLWLFGDLLCQTLVHITQEADLSPSSTTPAIEGKIEGKRDPSPFAFIDWKRAGLMTCYGFCISAPACAIWYTQLERMSQKVFAPHAAPMKLPSWLINNSILSKPLKRFLVAENSQTLLRRWKIIGFKLGMDTIVFDPIYLSIFFITTSAMEGHSLDSIRNKLREEFAKTWLIDVGFWTPIQILNFRYVPVLYQSLVVQSCNIGWNAYLSFVQHKTQH